jgi:hypothetical protein
MLENVILLTTSNPDSASISRKAPISYTVAYSDINAIRELSASIKLSGDETFQVVTIPVVDEEPAKGTVYYTPIYKEKINYNEWINKINRNFNELT